MTKYEIGFTSKTWHELSDELGVSYVKIKKYLNASITLSDYGSGIESILCFFVCVPFKDKNKEHVRFYNSDKGLDIVRQLNYEIFSQLSVEEALKMQAKVFLAALENVKNRKKQIPDFDFPRFYEDIVRLFREKNWID